MKQHRLIAATGGSCIDFVCSPQELFEAVSCAGICVEAGRRLQLVNIRRLFDHVLVQVSSSYSLDLTGFSQAGVWGEARSGPAAQVRDAWEEKNGAVTKELETLSVEMESQVNECTPESLAATFIFIRRAKVVFGVKKEGRNSAQRADAEQLAVLLRQRRALRQRLHGCSADTG